MKRNSGGPVKQASMQTSVLSTMPAGGTELRFGEFARAIAESVVELDMRCEDPGRFRGYVAGASGGDSHLLRIASSSETVSRTRAIIERSPQEYYKFTVMEEGSGVFIQEGHEALLLPGDMTIYSTDLPYTLLFDQDVRLTVLMFPKDMLRLPLDAVRTVVGTRISGTQGAGAVVHPYISALAEHAGDLDGSMGRRLLRRAVGMVSDLIEPRSMPAEDRYTRLRRAALDYIEENLSNPELDPAHIAAAHYVSLRQLYCAFEGTGTSVAAVIRSRRLERCFDQLADPRLTDHTTASIGLARFRKVNGLSSRSGSSSRNTNAYTRTRMTASTPGAMNSTGRFTTR